MAECGNVDLEASNVLSSPFLLSQGSITQVTMCARIPWSWHRLEELPSVGRTEESVNVSDQPLGYSSATGPERGALNSNTEAGQA